MFLTTEEEDVPMRKFVHDDAVKGDIEDDSGPFEQRENGIYTVFTIRVVPDIEIDSQEKRAQRRYNNTHFEPEHASVVIEAVSDRFL